MKAVVPGTPHREICRYAQQNDIDLIVMGTHGRTGLAHVTMGSVAQKVVATAPCQVLVVRHPDQEDDLVQQATKLLRDEFGTTFGGEFGETRATLKGRLMRMLNVSEQAAEFVVEKLRAEEMFVWDEPSAKDTSQPHSGTWRIGPFAAVEDPGAPVFQPKDDDSPAIDLVNRAVALRGTDIHIDAVGRGYSVRFRIDGRLQRYCELDADVATHLIQQFKTMARLDIADPFHPQEGRLRLPPALAQLEVRITTSPVAGGEAVALRLFDRENVFRPLDRLGLSEQSLAAIDGMTQRGEGLVLVTGPTGSGKTTTVYSMLETISSGERNIVSIEDPVEFPASFVRQMEVDERHGVTMTSGLRTLLRMDPDIVFLGEIRDAEAAEISMRAASSGKYVFSTLHTRDVASTLTALRDLRVDTRSLAGNLTGIISQRLVRRLCPQCRQATSIDDEQRALFQDARHRATPATVPVRRLLHLPRHRLSRPNRRLRGRPGRRRVPTRNRVAAPPSTSSASTFVVPAQPDLTTDALTKVAGGITSLDEALRMHSV